MAPYFRLESLSFISCFGLRWIFCYRPPVSDARRAQVGLSVAQLLFLCWEVCNVSFVGLTRWSPGEPALGSVPESVRSGPIRSDAVRSGLGRRSAMTNRERLSFNTSSKILAVLRLASSKRGSFPPLFSTSSALAALMRPFFPRRQLGVFAFAQGQRFLHHHFDFLGVLHSLRSCAVSSQVSNPYSRNTLPRNLCIALCM